jgi:hypothetical protein
VEAVRPAASGHHAPGELVHDDDLAVLDHVVHVPLEEGVGLERLADVVEHFHLRRVVEILDVQEPLAVRDALLGQRHRPRLLVHDVVARRRGLDLREFPLHDRRRALELGMIGRSCSSARSSLGGPR